MNSRSIKSPRTYQYSLRLDAQHRNKLNDIASYQHQPKSRVIDALIDDQWSKQQCHRQFQSLLSQHLTPEEQEQWVFEHYGHNISVVAELASAGAIFDYSEQLRRTDATRQDLVNDLDTFAFLFKNVGVNINQIAHQANSGEQIDLTLLKQFTQQLIDLKNAVDALKNKV